MLIISSVSWDLTDAFQVLMLDFMRAWSCWCALNLLWWDQNQACFHLHDWNPGGFKQRNFWIPLVVWDYSAVVCKSCPWLCWERRLTHEGNSCDQGRSQTPAARGFNSSGIRRILNFNFQLGDFVCRLNSSRSPVQNQANFTFGNLRMLTPVIFEFPVFFPYILGMT